MKFVILFVHCVLAPNVPDEETLYSIILKQTQIFTIETYQI